MRELFLNRDGLLWLMFLRRYQQIHAAVEKTVTGALLHITDALAKPAKKFVATLSPVQDLHGQDAPYPAGGGKNKLDSSFCLDRTAKGITTKVNADGSITVTGTSDGTGRYWNSADTLGLILEAGTYTLSPSILRLEKKGGGVSSGTFTLSEQQEYQNAYFLGWSSGETVNTTVYPQLEVGSTATSYAPYKNICPITGHTGANVVRTGKNVAKFAQNILDEDRTQNGITFHATSENTVKISGTATDAAFLTSGSVQTNMYLKAGTYTVSSNIANTASTRVYLTSVTNPISYHAVYANHSVTLTFNKDIPDVNIQISVGQGATFDDDVWVQVEQGSTATTYEPYSGTTYSLTFPDAAGTVYGGTLTNEDGEWKMRVTDVLFEKNTSTMDNNNEDYPGWRNCGITAIIGSGYNKIFSNQQMNIGTMYGANTNSSNDLIILPKDGNSGYGKTQTEWIALAQDVQIVIPLATPIEYTLTESQALMLLKGENNIWVNDSDDLELKYLAKAGTTP